VLSLRGRSRANDGGFQVHCVKFNGTRNAQDGGVGGQCQVLASPMRRRPSRRWLSRGPGTLLAFLFHVLETRQYRSNALASKPSVIQTESFDGTIWRWRARRHCEAGGFIAGAPRGEGGCDWRGLPAPSRKQVLAPVDGAACDAVAGGLRPIGPSASGCCRRELTQMPELFAQLLEPGR
jgi:hypothetical protein